MATINGLELQSRALVDQNPLADQIEGGWFRKTLYLEAKVTKFDLAFVAIEGCSYAFRRKCKQPQSLLVNTPSEKHLQTNVLF